MLRWLARWWWGGDPPVPGQTLQERYPAAEGAFTTSYSSVDLPEEAFIHACPWCGHRAQLLAYVNPTIVVSCPSPHCKRISKVTDVTEFWGPETRLV